MMRTEDSVRWSNSPVGAGCAVSLLHTIPFDSTSGLRKQAWLWGAALGVKDGVLHCEFSAERTQLPEGWALESLGFMGTSWSPKRQSPLPSHLLSHKTEGLELIL